MMRGGCLPPLHFFNKGAAMEEVRELYQLSRMVKRNGSWDYVAFIPNEEGFEFDLEKAKKNKKYLTAYKLGEGFVVFVKATSKEEALKRLAYYLTIADEDRAVEWLKSNPVKELGRETLKFGKYQVYRGTDGRLYLTYNRYYLKELERKIHKVCHKKHYKGARERTPRELIKFVNQIVRALRRESRYLWVPYEQKRGFNREVKKAVLEALTSIFGYRKRKRKGHLPPAVEVYDKYVLKW